MTGFTKLFQNIVTSSIWGEDDKTRIVWVTMLALANKNGVVESSLSGLVRMARVELPDVTAAIAKLEAPDLDSRTSTDEGRRIRKVEGGWFLINYAKYRAKMSLDLKREKNREKQARYRERKKIHDEFENGERKYVDESDGDARESVLDEIATPPSQK